MGLLDAFNDYHWHQPPRIWSNKVSDQAAKEQDCFSAASQAKKPYCPGAAIFDAKSPGQCRPAAKGDALQISKDETTAPAGTPPNHSAGCVAHSRKTVA